MTDCLSFPGCIRDIHRLCGINLAYVYRAAKYELSKITVVESEVWVTPSKRSDAVAIEWGTPCSFCQLFASVQKADDKAPVEELIKPNGLIGLGKSGPNLSRIR